MPLITLEDDIRITTFRPPSGFDPLVASASELKEYGFPARPENARFLELYRRVFGRLKGRLKYVEPMFRINRDNSSGPGSPTASAGAFTGNNWSGGVVKPPTGQSFQGVLGEWVVPSAFPKTPDRYFVASYWIGLDGFYSPGANATLQVGVQWSTSTLFPQRPASQHLNTSTLFPWHQWYPGPQLEITNLAISPGDLVKIHLSANRGAGATTATVYFANISSGAATSYSISAPTGVQLAGNSAEWIVETDNVDQLPDYGQVFFDSCMACSAAGSVVNGGTGKTLNIVKAGSMISQATSITPLVIQCSYNA